MAHDNLSLAGGFQSLINSPSVTETALSDAGTRLDDVSNVNLATGSHNADDSSGWDDSQFTDKNSQKWNYGNQYLSMESDNVGWLQTIQTSNQNDIPWSSTYAGDTNMTLFDSVGAHFGTSYIKHPSRSGGDNYTMDYHNDPLHILAAAEGGQTWSFRGWFKNTQNVEKQITIWIFGVDEGGKYNHSGFEIDSGNSTDPDFDVNTGGTSYYKILTMEPANQFDDWYLVGMTVTLTDETWIKGITVRIDNDYNGTGGYIYYDSLGLWRRNCSLSELTYGHKDILYQKNRPGGLSLGDTLAGIRGGHWVGSHGTNLPRAYDKLGFYIDPARSPSMEVGDTVCRSRIRKYGGSTRYFICRGATGEPLQGNHTPNDSNFPTKYTDNNSFHGGVFNFSGGKGMNIQEDLEDYFNFAFGEWTIAFWIRFTSTNVQYFWDGRNGDTGQPNWMLWNYNPGGGSTTDTYHINVGNEKTKWNFSDNSGFVGGSGIGWASANTPLNKWMHVLYAQDDDEHRLAINGKVVNEGQGGLDINGNMNKNFRLGCRYNTTNQFTGYYGPVAMWNVSVNAEDILQTYKAQRNRFGHDQIMINVKWAGDNPTSSVRARVYRYFGNSEDYLLTDNQQFYDGHDYISCNDPDLQSGDKLKIQFYNITQFQLDATGNTGGGGDLSSSALQVNGDVSWYSQTANTMSIVVIVTDAEPRISLVVGFDNQASGGGSGGN